ncbi:hypothetical protein HY501_01250 [Candidatus Woesearchaeota archaeon]|nr:hypothetical protein [Candidatus Woesearchaeota archaeon]
MEGFKLLNKTVIRFSQAREFFQAVTANTLDKNKNAFVDRFGKIVVVFDQIAQGDDVYVVFVSKYEHILMKHLEAYLRLSKVEYHQLPLQVAHIISEKKAGDLRIPQNIGYLSLLNDLSLLSSLDELSDEEYEQLRIENNLPLQGKDFEHEMLLEVSEDAVSFTKGCFLGQEILARVHNLGKPARKLVRILYSAVPKSVTIHGKEVGKITSSCFSEKYGKWIVFALVSNFSLEIDNGHLLTD